MKSKQILVKFNGFDVTLNFKKGVKNLRLRVAKTGEISMSLPFYSTQKAAFGFLQRHERWLAHTHERVVANLPRDDEIWLLGEKFSVKFEPNLNETKVARNEIFMPNLASLEKFKKQYASKIYHELIAKFQPLVNRPINRVTIRKMKTRWGSCNSRKGYINLSLALVEKPLPQVEYVVLHELAHLLYPHHRREFYDFIASLMPDFRTRERALNGKIL